MNQKLNELKRELAKALVVYGINLPNNDYVLVDSCTDDISFTNMVIEELYKSGVKRVIVKWRSSLTAHLHYLYGDKKYLSTRLPFEKEQDDFIQNKYVPRLLILSEAFDELEGVDLKKVTEINAKLRAEKYKNASKIFKSHWTGVFIPSTTWAEKLFPKLPIGEARNKTWEVFLNVMRVEKGKTLINWKNHLANLKKKSAYLNKLNIDSLHYKSSNGTDLIVGLTDKSMWIGGTHTSEKTKREYNPNFPTEEIFTTPHRLRTEGIVYSSKPLCVSGQLIEGICFKFKKGKIVEIHAKKNEALLKRLVTEDSNCAYLGEAALVPFNSLINKALPLFYSTIYDENACCHLAFGLGFDMAYKGHEKMKEKELFKKGVNKANNHIDFMIGTKDLSIVATTKDGKKVEIFKNGNWAINL